MSGRPQLVGITSTIESRGALGSAGGPELAELAAELLASSGPVVGDVFTQILNMALKVHLILLQPTNIKLLARGTSLKLTGNVLFVVTDNPVPG